ncbi:TPA: glycerate kinase [Candidatus Poribacteria bacterium]|nr:glycerate kinase [Candidatus Poribacteria bacterium]
MKIVIAPDSFKGSLTALQVSEAIEQGFKRIFPDAQMEKVPMADGGEGTVQSLVDATGGQLLTETVTDPLGGKIDATYGILGDGVTAVIEMAAASGLPLVPLGKRNPMLTTTYGTGELIKAALERSCRKFIIGIGGSATTDGGAGVAQALGAKLLDADGKDIPFGGIGLSKLAKIDMSTMDKRIAETETVVACDVDNPLTGPRGAAYVYSPQKGATPEQVELLDKYLGHFADIVKRDLSKDVKETSGAGAAGGLGAGLMAFLNAELKLGIDIVIEASNLRKRMQGADLVITGEGQLDEQTAYGKTPTGVSKIAKQTGIPVLAIAGGIAPGAETSYQEGIDAMMSIAPGPISLQEAIERAAELIAETAERAARIIKIGFNLVK